MNEDTKQFLNDMYNSLFNMSTDKRNKILFDIFGWAGARYYAVLREARLKDNFKG